ncbi:hypothetical protein PUN28_012418 [Cardiocondyla obscurior]|uniref:Secreted protein n=1 Tax=Cardiocondyla obscurior TaxID=286306 RepID=A0AAW2FFD6_9HYME
MPYAVRRYYVPFSFFFFYARKEGKGKICRRRLRQNQSVDSCSRKVNVEEKRRAPFHEHNRVLDANTQMRESSIEIRPLPAPPFASRLRGFLFNKTIVANESHLSDKSLNHPRERSSRCDCMCGRTFACTRQSESAQLKASEESKKKNK